MPSPHPYGAAPADDSRLPAFIDVEASGFGRGSWPIEVGFVRSDRQPVCTLVRPATGWTHWDVQAQAVHGIDPLLLQRHGRPVPEVAELLNRHLAGQRVYCDGWAQDYAWLARLFDEAERPMAFSLHHVRELLDETQARRWGSACDAARTALRLQRHRASNDARVMQNAWLLLNAQSPAEPAGPASGLSAAPRPAPAAA